MDTDTERAQQDDGGIPDPESSDDRLPFLPDDVVVKILEFLPTRELFSVRIVCRRWADLALHPDVWRGRRLSERSGVGSGVLDAALRLAPRVKSLDLSSFAPDEPGTCLLRRSGDLLATTRCAAEGLRLYVNEEEAANALSALENQVALGRLRQLTVLAMVSPGVTVAGTALPDLYRASLAVEGLTEMLFFPNEFQPDWLPQGHPRSSSLRELSYFGREGSGYPCLRFLLDRHARTLETLTVSCSDKPVDYSDDGGRVPSARWLERASRLSILVCPVMRDMEALLRLPHLEDLTLMLSSSLAVVNNTGVREYLRAATSLRKLSVTQDNDEEDVETGDAALLALDVASNSQSPLERLSLHFKFRGDGDEALGILMAAVSGLGALRMLSVCCDFAATLRLLECLSHVRAPSCKSEVGGHVPSAGVKGGASLTLHNYLLYDALGGCWHGWLHENEPQIRKFFRTNPALHLRLEVFEKFRCVEPQLCSSCLLQCHAASTPRRDEDQTRVSLVLFGHAEDYSCDLPHDHSDPKTAYLCVI